MSNKKDQVKTDADTNEETKGTGNEPEVDSKGTADEQATSKIQEENERLNWQDFLLINGLMRLRPNSCLMTEGNIWKGYGVLSSSGITGT